MIFNEIIDLYEKKLSIPNNVTCSECDALYKAPLLPWHIGEQYFSEEGRILFIGKPHRGEQPKNSIKRESNIIDARKRADELYATKSWPYWSYPRNILSKLYGSASKGWEHIAFTNLVKCTSTSGTDKTSLMCTEKCVNENQVIYEEIKLLKPKKIVLFTWSLYRNILDDLIIAKENSIIEHTNKNHKIACGKKSLGWWDRSFESIWNETVDILVVGHPERMHKDDYTNAISEWLKKT